MKMIVIFFFFVLAQNYKTEQKEGKCVIPLLYSYLSLHGNISASLVLEDIVFKCSDTNNTIPSCDCLDRLCNLEI